MKTTYHVLSGDAMRGDVESAALEGEIVIAREALVEGPLSGDTLEEFWKTRGKYHSSDSGGDGSESPRDVRSEFEKIILAPPASEFNLWFGYELFCQVNLWFVLSLIGGRGKGDRVFVVYPSHLARGKQWDDFGQVTVSDLKTCFNSRIELSKIDLELGRRLWEAFRRNDLAALESLATTPSSSFPYLKDVCRAHADRFVLVDGRNRPERVVEHIIRNTSTDFQKVFGEFRRREGVYGFGDTQVRTMYDRIMRDR